MLPPTILEGMETTPVSSVVQAFKEALLPPVSSLADDVEREQD